MENSMYVDALCFALRVEFITTREELFMYADAIYLAMLWGNKEQR